MSGRRRAYRRRGRAPTARGLRLVVALAAMAAIAACTDRQTGDYDFQIHAMGTIVDVSVHGVSEERAQRANERLAASLRAFGRRWWAWGDGDLARLNADLADDGKATLTPGMARVLRQAKQLSIDSGGLFNPAVGPLVKLWGFDQPVQQPLVPPAHRIAALLPVASMAQITIGETLLTAPPGTWLDLGGFAKGIAVDEAIASLRALGIDNAIVNAGGDLRAIGQAGDRPWSIGIRAPRGDGVLASVQTDGDDSVFTSGDYERTFVLDGRRYHHVIDPRTGRPVTGVQSVTVIDDRAGVADAAATALFVAGVEAWPGVAAQLGVDKVMMVLADGGIQLTPAMQRRIYWHEPSVARRAQVRMIPTKGGAPSPDSVGGGQSATLTSASVLRRN